MSLVEVMIASSILVIVVTSAAGSIAMGFNLVSDRRFRTMGEAVAASHMETLIASSRDRYLEATDCDPVVYSREVVAGGTLFTASCQIVRNTPAVAVADRFARLTVNVSWRHLGRVSKTSFSTYIESEP
jgi:Tfp pilus assembly protein PilV